MRFEYFLVLLQNTDFVIGNSSTGLREAPYYNIPTINIGSRQNNRAISEQIINCTCLKNEILKAINIADSTYLISKDVDFGNGNSDKLFLELLEQNTIWNIPHQKQFQDI